MTQDLVHPDSNYDAGGTLVCENVTKSYVSEKGETRLALDGVSLRVAPGEFVAIVGPSGCGKSTLLRIVDGLVAATSGLVEVGGRVVEKPGADRAMVFQADSLFPWRTVEQNVWFGLELQGMPKSERQRETARLLEVGGLASFARAFPFELSGGMRQRVNLLRALAVNPQVMLMDEPFAALDAQTRESMQAEIVRIWSVNKKTVLFVTHGIEEAIFLADRVIVMSARPGRIKAEYVIDIPRPREPGVQRTADFIEISRQIWEELRPDLENAPK